MRTKGSDQKGSLCNIEGPTSRRSMTDRENWPGRICGTNSGFKFKWERCEVGLDLDWLARLIELANFRAARFVLFGGGFVVVLRADAHAGWDEHEQGDPG